ncbi:NAD(P)/FAD-dependent oxidoreductase [Asaia bogorensis]|uniref:NAD(P)/FAD-dependent oxidoreductase n=1 Tax=Asaia bogorensis TaxID=91915 RepID=UPI0028658F3C|nr:tryptophan 7-halogenase [Asaia bogorensis]MDR6182786.1 flavin-dependent dehydrogenase [Asaia bogorensis NBRC 16594]
MSANNPQPVHDVLIMGAGLASLTLAKQLLDKQPTLDICIVHNRKFPYPERIHKVGESTVEIGAYYLAQVVGCKTHLETQHLRKMGLRFIQTQGLTGEAPYRELGLEYYPYHTTYQIDRGRLENYLRDELGNRVTLIENCRVLGMEKGSDHNTVSVRDHDGAVTTRDARWVVDASGRGRVLMKQFSLQKEAAVNHSAVWFRVGGDVDINEFLNSADAANPFTDAQERGRSTTHLVGKGYWVWIIPINKQTTSIGIVFDNSVHKLSEMSSHPLASDWLRRHEPRMQDYLEEKAFEVIDFVMLRNYSYLSKQYLSEDGWALTGEAAGFVDPMYSNGTDLIGLANTMITNAITRPDGKQLIGQMNDLLSEVYAGFVDTHHDSSPRFDDWNYMFVKTNWDACFYFMFMCVLFMNDKFDDIEFVESIHGTVAEFYKIHHEVMTYLRTPGAVQGNYELADFISLVGSIQDHANRTIFLDDKSNEAVAARLEQNLETLRELAASIITTQTFDENYYNMGKRLDAA